MHAVRHLAADDLTMNLRLTCLIVLAARPRKWWRRRLLGDRAVSLLQQGRQTGSDR